MKNGILILIVILIYSNVNAQDIVKNRKVKFTSSQQIGMSVSSSGGSPTLSILAGVSLSKWDFQVGGTVTKYTYFMAPYYFDTRFYFLKKRKEYVFANLGNTNLLQRDLPLTWNAPPASINASLFGTAGIGVKRKMGGELFYIVQIGFNYCKINFDSYTQPWQGELITESNKIIRKGIDFKLGLCF
jgi:hypothetical protein